MGAFESIYGLPPSIPVPQDLKPVAQIIIRWQWVILLPSNRVPVVKKVIAALQGALLDVEKGSLVRIPLPSE